jgi:hypothetical protein
VHEVETMIDHPNAKVLSLLTDRIIGSSIRMNVQLTEQEFRALVWVTTIVEQGNKVWEIRKKGI